MADASARPLDRFLAFKTKPSSDYALRPNIDELQPHAIIVSQP
jgi:hypothetical protein